MKDDAFDHVNGRMPDPDDISAGLRAGALEKVIAEGARAGLDGAARHRTFSAFDRHFDPQPLAEPSHMVRSSARTRLQRATGMSRDHAMAFFVDGRERGRAVRPPPD